MPGLLPFFWSGCLPAAYSLFISDNAGGSLDGSLNSLFFPCRRRRSPSPLPAPRSNTEHSSPPQSLPQQNRIQQYNHNTKKAAKKITTARAFQASKDLSEKELLEAVTESSKTAAVGVAKVTIGVAEPTLLLLSLLLLFLLLLLLLLLLLSVLVLLLLTLLLTLLLVVVVVVLKTERPCRLTAGAVSFQIYQPRRCDVLRL